MRAPKPYCPFCANARLSAIKQTGGRAHVSFRPKHSHHSVCRPHRRLAGKIVQGTGFGLIGDIAIGIVGAFIASWLFPRLGFALGTGMVREILDATIGAVLLLVIIRLVRRGGRW